MTLLKVFVFLLTFLLPLHSWPAQTCEALFSEIAKRKPAQKQTQKAKRGSPSLLDALIADLQLKKEAVSNFKKTKGERESIYDFVMPRACREELTKALRGLEGELRLLRQLRTGKTPRHLLKEHIQLLESERSQMKDLLSRKSSTYWEYVESMLRGNIYFDLFNYLTDFSYGSLLASAEKRAGYRINEVKRVLDRHNDHERLRALVFLTTEVQNAEDLSSTPVTGVARAQTIFDRKNQHPSYPDSGYMVSHDLNHAVSTLKAFEEGYVVWFKQLASDLDSVVDEKLKTGVGVHLFDRLHEQKDNTITQFRDKRRLSPAVAEDSTVVANERLGDEAETYLELGVEWLTEFLRENPLFRSR